MRKINKEIAVNISMPSAMCDSLSYFEELGQIYEIAENCKEVIDKLDDSIEKVNEFAEDVEEIEETLEEHTTSIASLNSKFNNVTGFNVWSYSGTCSNIACYGVGKLRAFQFAFECTDIIQAWDGLAKIEPETPVASLCCNIVDVSSPSGSTFGVLRSTGWINPMADLTNGHSYLVSGVYLIA